MPDVSPSESSAHSSMTVSTTVENDIELPKSEIVPLAAKVSNLISTCRICLSSIFKPASLTCGHRFCEKCLDQYWRIREKPTCIICPLCRACAFNVDFTKDDKVPSTNDFRKSFSPTKVKEINVDRVLMSCIKITAITPALYFLVKWLQPTFAYLISYFVKFTNKT